MKTLLQSRPAALAVLTLAVLTTSCFVVRETRKGSGVEGTQTRELATFTSIAVAGSAEVDVVVGGPPSVRITIDDNLLQYVITEVDDGTLEIHMSDEFNYDRSARLRAEVVAPSLDGISVAGSGSVEIRGVETSHFGASIAGSGTVAIHDVQTNHFDASIAGSGDLRVDGRTETLEVSISGSGDVDTLALRSQRVEVSIAGSGDVLVNASEDLDVSVAGSGDVGYRGDPKISRSILGSGSVYAANSSDI
jgi:hypothetical protein